MYLKELTLRGFKSFALPTTLRFQPGITAVVGPNGSGKSNIVDALAWVMGEQAARQLRGSSMQDVIFAGTATRPSLGRAQVSLTIDNSDHALNIEYSEVTISRTIYRNGGSEYSINGQPARLLDVQDLLSDAGLGSQMHVIIGQGQLSRILNADPQGHRAIIDEAAGVLKHRKRKERSLRRLDSTQRNLQRLDDIIAQLSKQLGPLERQSRAARKAGELSEAIAQHKTLLFADQLRSVETAYHSTLEQLTTIRTQLKSLRRELAQVKSEVEAQELTSQASDPQIRELAATLNSYQQLSSRLESLDVLTSERVRALTGRLESLPEENHSGEILRARAAETMSDATASEQAEKQAQEEVEAARRHREELEKQLVSTRRTLTELRESARKKQGALTKLVQLVAGRQAMNQASQARLTQLSDQLVQARVKLSEAHTSASQIDEEASQEQSDALAAQVQQLSTSLTELSDEVQAAEQRVQEAEARRIRFTARADAVSDTLTSRHHTSSRSSVPKIATLGALAEWINVDTGWEDAVSRALAQWADSLVLADPSTLGEALDQAAQHSGVKQAFLLASASGSRPTSSVASGSAVSRSARSGSSDVTLLASKVHADSTHNDAHASAVLANVHRALDGIAAAETIVEAQHLLQVEPTLRAVMVKTGELLTHFGGVTRSTEAPSDLALVSRRNQARAQAQEAQQQRDNLKQHADELSRQQESLRQQLNRAQEQLHQAQLEAGRRQERLKQANQQVAEQERWVERLEKQKEQEKHELSQGVSELEELTHSLNQARLAAQSMSPIEDAEKQERELEVSVTDAQREHMIATQKLAEQGRRTQSLKRQAQMLTDQALLADKQTQQTAHQRATLTYRLSLLQQAHEKVQTLADFVTRRIAAVQSQHEQASKLAQQRDNQVSELRARRRELEPQVAQLEKSEHDADLARERLSIQLTNIGDSVRSQLGYSLEQLRKNTQEQSAAQQPFDRAGVQEELEALQRKYQRLGAVNPLAREEYDALNERLDHLKTQRNDVAQSVKDLHSVVGNLDSTMVDVFQQAFTDISRKFTEIFAELFPGGTGRLRLEDPDHPLTTGVVVEASPAGKRVKALSLLSGGEKSLTALALLLAIFEARPSPFCIMDEVEAALDDLNLTRLLAALKHLRESAQLLIITHQQRTMSIADVLYGVTMRADGVTAVISQSLEEISRQRENSSDNLARS